MLLLVFHIAVSIVAVLSGAPVVQGLLVGRYRRLWSGIFLCAVAVTCGSGLLLPAAGVTPAVATALLGLVGVAVAAYTLLATQLQGGWRRVFAVSIVVLEYFNVLVLVAQAFKHVAFLHLLAPVGNEPLVAAVQGVVLVAFVLVGIRAFQRFAGSPLPSPSAAGHAPPT